MTIMVKIKTDAHGDDDNGNNSDDDVVVVVDDDGDDDNSDNDDYANIVQSVVPFTNMFADLSIDK